jgi:exoribonuclease-2
MLPERLSTDLTSLNQDQERLAIVVSMDIAADGTVKGSDVYRALVLNRAKLAYNSLAAWMDGHGPIPPLIPAVPGLEDNLRLQDRVAQAPQRQRHNAARSAWTRSKHGRSSTATCYPISGPARRIGDRADQLHDRRQRRDRASSTRTTSLDSAVPPHPTAGTASSRSRRRPAGTFRHQTRRHSAFLNQRRQDDSDGFADLSLAVVKLLGSGECGVAGPDHPQVGHFGLAVRDYAHSTAPNRRFPDLATQRLLKAALADAPVPYSTDELTQLARHCTVQEDNAAKVERQVRKSAAALLMRSRIGETFEGVVTGASAKGTWVRTRSPLVEGRVVEDSSDLMWATAFASSCWTSTWSADSSTSPPVPASRGNWRGRPCSPGCCAAGTAAD